ncbi:NifB/NifX family molybdenum-iron cluster-binding protein [Vibrio astriarenae]|jgi:nitrogen fixation protein NifX
MQSQLPISESSVKKLATAMAALEYSDSKLFLQLISSNVNGDINARSLASFTPKRWRAMLTVLGHSFSRKQIDRAYAAITSGLDDENVGEFVLEPPLDSNKLVVAFASNSGERLDGHFGSCIRLLIYHVSKVEKRLVEVKEIDSDAKGELRTQHLVSLINECDLVFALSIGGAAAAKITRAGIHPIKAKAPIDIHDKIAEIQSAIDKGVAPWLSQRLTA